MSPSERPTSEPNDQEPDDSTDWPVTVMTMRTYRVRPDGTRTGYTPTVVVPATLESRLAAASGLPPCRCPRCRPQGRGAGS